MNRSALLYLVAVSILIANPAKADDTDDDAFAKLWDAARKDPDKADYKAIRTAYVKTSKYQPYRLPSKESEAMKKAMKAKDTPGAIAAMNALLDKKPLDVDAHMQAAFLHSQGGDEKLEKMHLALARGLAVAIVEGHKGTSFDDAVPVLSIDEEYVVLKVLGFESKGHALKEHNGRRYDVHMVDLPDKKGDREVYFDVTTPMNELSKMLRPKK